MLTKTGFTRLAASYHRFAMNERGGEKFLDLLLDAVNSCGVRDAVIERALDRAVTTNHMVDIERAKELFHSRLRALHRAGRLPEGVDPDQMFEDVPKLIKINRELKVDKRQSQ